MANSTSSSSSSSFSSFTITQPFLGAPLQFQPALGSKQLEVLVDAFVTGSASKQDKLSQVTIDFFNHATVDLLTGALVRRYDVVLPYTYEQSPYDSQSSSFSPPMFTPSPTRDSISTPATRNSRVAKKARKETKKVAEAKIPGFQIMTKDGVDVTSSAGRGTKSKEQREHAHLMRIMKACDACKKKKVRCDPSHRRSHTEMSRTSTKTSSSSISNQSPAVSTPSLSLSRETTNTSTGNTPSYETNAIDDFVLFPEDTASWNPADMSLPGFDMDCDLSQFNFDINDAGVDMSDLDQSFDFSSFEQPAIQHSSYPLYDNTHYDELQWDGVLESQTEGRTRPHQSGSSKDSGNLDSSWFASSNGDLEFNDSPVSGISSSFSQTNFTPQTPALQDSSTINASSVSFSAMDWNMSDPSSSGDGDISPHSNQGFRRPANATEGGTLFTPLNQAAILRLLDTVPSYSSESGTFVDTSDQQTISSGLGHVDYPQATPSECSSRTGLAKIHRDINRTSAMVTASLEAINSSSRRTGYETLSDDLLQLRDVLDNAKSGNVESILRRSLHPATQTLSTQLQGLFTRSQRVSPSSRPVAHQVYSRLDPNLNLRLVRQCSINARRLSTALRLATDSLQQRSSSTASQSGVSISTVTTNSHSSSVQQDRDEYSVPQDAGLSTLIIPTGIYADSGYSSSSSSSGIQSSLHYADSLYGLSMRSSGVSHLVEDFNEYGAVSSAVDFSAAGLTALLKESISKVPPHVPVSDGLDREGPDTPSEASLATPISPVETSVPSRNNPHQQTSQQVQRESIVSQTEPAMAQTVTISVDSLLLDTTQLAPTSPAQHTNHSTALLSSRSVGSFTSSSLAISEEYAWGAIPQTVLERQAQSLEGGSSKMCNMSSATATALCAVSLIVTILQAFSPAFMNAMTYLSPLSDTATAPLDSMSIVSKILLCFIAIALPSTAPISKVVSVSRSLGLSSKLSTPVKSGPVLDISKTWPTLQSSMMKTVKGHWYGHGIFSRVSRVL